MPIDPVCEACRQTLSAGDKVVAVRQQGVAADSRGEQRLIDVGPVLFFHEGHWRGGVSRTRFRVQGRGSLDSVSRVP